MVRPVRQLRQIVAVSVVNDEQAECRLLKRNNSSNRNDCGEQKTNQ